MTRLLIIALLIGACNPEDGNRVVEPFKAKPVAHVVLEALQKPKEKHGFELSPSSGWLLPEAPRR